MDDREPLPPAYLAVVAGLPEAALLYDRHGLAHVNPEGLRRLHAAGLTDEDLASVCLDELVAAQDRPALEDASSRAASGEAVPPRRLRRQARGGTHMVTSCVFTPIELDGRRYVQLLARDVSARVLVEQGLARSEARFRALFDHSPIGLALLEDGRFVVVNPAMTRILGRPAEEIVGRGPEEFTLAEELPVHRAAVDAVRWGETAQASKRYVRPDGTVAWGELTALLLAPQDGDAPDAPRAVLAQLRDVTAEREAAALLQHAALHDPMTGLGNRALLDQRLAQVTASRADRRGGVAVLFLDLDGFKQVNDAFGHAVGDEALKAAATRIRDAVRPGDTVVRWGGDEFVVLLDGLAHQQEALTVVRRIETAVAAPIPHRDDELRVTTSTGIAYAGPGDSPTPAQRVHDADAALYRAKQTGRNRHSVYDEGLRQAAARPGHVESLLRQAADGDRAVLHYQPVVDLMTGRVVGAEALLRLEEDHGTLLYPDAFLDIAEDIGLMVAVDRFVLPAACRWTAGQHARGRDLTVAVNVCVKQLGEIEEFERQVHAALRWTGLPADRLVLEVAEHAVLDISDRVIAGMCRLQEAGVDFSVDDFGAGHASIDYLHRLPVQEIKIDRAYTARAYSRPVDAAAFDVLLSDRPPTAASSAGYSPGSIQAT